MRKGQGSILESGSSAAGMPVAELARRDEILATAASLFASAGYAGTSLKEVADACGILPGSLYHHFDSKEAIAIELVERFHTELEEVGRRAREMVDRTGADQVYDQVLALSIAIARSGMRHRAALQLTLYEPHVGASDRLVVLTQRAPMAIQEAMEEILRGGRTSGFLRPEIDPALLAEQTCETMRHVGLAYMHRNASADEVATTLCHMLLDGVATRSPLDADLDRSDAMLVANAAVAEWEGPKDAEFDEKVALLRSVARAEFARRGYEATTVRDIASAADMGTGSVYRFIESKEALLASIMGSYHARLSVAYRAVMASSSTTVEKLDALTWLNINVQDKFSEEFWIQQAWLRAKPPAASTLSTSHEQRTRQIGKLVAEGLKSGQLRVGYLGGASPRASLVTMCVRDLIWLNPRIVERTGKRVSLEHSREALLRGACAPGELNVAAERGTAAL